MSPFASQQYAAARESAVLHWRKHGRFTDDSPPESHFHPTSIPSRKKSPFRKTSSAMCAVRLADPHPPRHTAPFRKSFSPCPANPRLACPPENPQFPHGRHTCALKSPAALPHVQSIHLHSRRAFPPAPCPQSIFPLHPLAANSTQQTTAASVPQNSPGCGRRASPASVTASAPIMGSPSPHPAPVPPALYKIS